MSIDSTTKSSLYRKKTMKSILSQSDNHPYSRRSLKNHQQRSYSMQRTASSTEEISGDILTDLSSLPHMTYKQVNNKRNRRFSELKPSHIQQIKSTNSERRNSTSQINFSALLPNPFRSNKHHKNTYKDETNTTTNTSNSTSSLHHNDMMTMKTELPSSLKLSTTTINGSRANLSVSNDRLSIFIPEDSRSSSISSGSSVFILDTDPDELRSAETLKLELHTPLCVGEIYREHFFEYFHTNYCGEFEREGPFIASLRYFYAKSTDDTDANTSCQARAIIRTSSRNNDVSVVIDGTNEDNIVQILFTQANLPVPHTYKTIGDPKANEKIYLFDKQNDERQNCKIGLIYQRSDQTVEYDIYSNDFLSIDLSDFLEILADRVRLKGFTKYRGDLDIRDDLHGEYSYYTEYQNHEIMFNIAPIILSTKANGQCIERKGLVGNSFVCIVFQEPNAEFSPDLISGKVTQIYITVQPHKTDEQIYYKIGIWHRSDVTRTIDPSGGIYRCDSAFRDYFLTLLLNSVNVAIESPSLRGRIVEQRQRLKREDLRKLSQILCVGQTLNITTDFENINNHGDQRSKSRSDSSVSSTTPTGNETVIPNPVRTKRGLSKIFSVFSGRPGSMSSTTPSPPTAQPPNFPNHDVSSVNPSLLEINMIQGETGPLSGKEPIRRTTSAKGRPAPPPPSAPPIPPRIPVSKTQSIPVPQPCVSLLSSNISLNTTVLEEPIRNRSNSSPGDSINTTTKTQSSTVSSISEETDNTDSSVDEDFVDDSSEDDKIEHRQTITEPPLFLTTNTNS